MQAIFLVDEGRNVKTATDRAAEAIETAETIFADEMGATLDLSPAAVDMRLSRARSVSRSPTSRVLAAQRCI